MKGAIAQLVERMNGIHEVTGSTPVSSTILRTHEDQERWFLLRMARPVKEIFIKRNEVCPSKPWLSRAVFRVSKKNFFTLISSFSLLNCLTRICTLRFSRCIYRSGSA